MELHKLLSCSEQDFIQFTGCVGKNGDGRGDEDVSDLGDEPGCVCKRSLHSGKRPVGARRACRLSSLKFSMVFNCKRRVSPISQMKNGQISNQSTVLSSLW